MKDKTKIKQKIQKFFVNKRKNEYIKNKDLDKILNKTYEDGYDTSIYLKIKERMNN